MKIIFDELKKFGCSEETYERLLIHGGQRGLLSWYVDRILKNLDQKEVVRTLGAMAVLMNLKYEQVKYLYFNPPMVKLSDVKRDDAYSNVRAALDEAYPNNTLWDNIMPYVYGACKNLACELTVRKGGLKIQELMDYFGMSRTKVYDVRKSTTRRMLLEKGGTL